METKNGDRSIYRSSAPNKKFSMLRLESSIDETLCIEHVESWRMAGASAWHLSCTSTRELELESRAYCTAHAAALWVWRVVLRLLSQRWTRFGKFHPRSKSKSVWTYPKPAAWAAVLSVNTHRFWPKASPSFAGTVYCGPSRFSSTQLTSPR